MTTALAFVCPRCRRALAPGETRWACAGCGAHYPVVDGIPLLFERATYYAEVERGQMEELLARTEHAHWRQVLAEYSAASKAHLYRIATDESRGDWRFLLPLEPSWTILDVGAGWGTVSAILARECAAVVACDTTAERLRFLRRRCRQEGLANVTAVGANILAPPFAPGQFDLAAIIGVLEWVPESTEDGQEEAPTAMQQRALHNVYELLKPGGYCYLAIENRYGFKYMLGAPDDHTGLEHVTYLPREAATRRTQNLLNRPYRTYTHALDDYRALLHDAGFAAIQTYYPLPDYKTAAAAARLDQREPLAYYLDVLAPVSPATSREGQVWALERAALAAGTLPQHAASFGFIARKEER